MRATAASNHARLCRPSPRSTCRRRRIRGEGLSAMRPTLGAGACRTSKPRGPACSDKPGGAGVVVGKLALELDQRGGKVGHGGASKRTNVYVMFLPHAPHLSLDNKCAF